MHTITINDTVVRVQVSDILTVFDRLVVFPIQFVQKAELCNLIEELLLHRFPLVAQLSTMIHNSGNQSTLEREQLQKAIKQWLEDPQGRKVLVERAAIAEGVAPWDLVLLEWFRVRDFNNSGDFDEEEYVHLNRRMHPRYFGDSVPFDEHKHRCKFKSMDTNKVSCVWPIFAVL